MDDLPYDSAPSRHSSWWEGHLAFSLTRAPAELRASPSVSAGRRLTRGSARGAALLLAHVYAGYGT